MWCARSRLRATLIGLGGTSKITALALLAAVPKHAAAETEWYGWQIAIVDGLAAGVVGGGLAMVDTGEGPLIATGVIAVTGGLVIYLAAGPGMHVRRERHDGIAWTSVGLRVVAPIAAATIATEATGCEPGSCRSEIRWGLLAGAGLAIASDWLLLSHAPVTPYVTPVPGAGATIGVGGRF